MSKENVLHSVITFIVAGVSAYFQIIAVPLIVLIAVMLLDYVTGMVAAYIRAELSSRKGIIGILKKLGYFALVCVGISVDYILYSALQQLGISNEITMLFGLIVTVWLIINELISILENLSKMDVPIPKFLTSVIQKLKTTVEDKTE